MDDTDPVRSPDDKKKSWRDTKTAGGLRAVGSSLSSSGQDMMDRAADERITPVSLKRGGKVRKTKMRGKKRAKSRE